MKKLKIGPGQIRAAFVPDTINDEARTIEVIFSTENPVRRYTWDGVIHEVLAHGKDNVRMERMNAGAPVLDNHNRWGKVGETQLGVVESAKVVGKEGRATLRFSKRDDVTPLWNDIKDGIVRNISVGYNVLKYEKSVAKEGETPTYRAIDWEPMEISITQVPADIKSGIRSAENEHLFREVEVIMRSEDPAPKPEATPPAPSSEENTRKSEIQDMTPEEVKAAEARAAEAATKAERTRVAEIRSAVKAAKLGGEFADKLIEDGVAVDAARAAIIEEWAKGDPNKGAQPGSSIEVKADEADKLRKRMTDGLTLRTTAGIESKMDAKEVEAAREFRDITLLRMAEETLRAAGVSVMGMSRREIATRALSTGDFPYILANVVNKTLRREYDQAVRTFLPWTSRNDVTDFKQVQRTQLGAVSQLAKVVEGAEYTHGTAGENKEVYSVAKYGKIIPITWETIINDDLGAFNRIPRSLANQAAQLQSDIVYAILSDNDAMNDGLDLFHSDHGNLAGSGGAISLTTLNAARKAMRDQVGLNSEKLNITPAYLLVGTAKEMEAYQYTSPDFVSAKSSDINPFKGALKVIVEPRISGNAWFLAADPGMIDTIEYAFLSGEPELFTEQRIGFEVDGMQIKARMVFGAKAIDHRGLYKNAGN